MTDPIFEVTERGKEELSQGHTRLAGAELELLVRTDGRLALSQIKQAMGTVDGDAFDAAFKSLYAGELVREARDDDPFDLQLQADLDSFTRVLGQGEADATLRSLNKVGFYVEIARERKRPSAVPKTAYTALVVEDDPFLAKFVQSFLAFEGATVRVAANRAEVVAALNQRPLPDVVLLDVSLPDVNGFDILQRIRQHRVLCDMPVLMLTGAATRKDVIRGITDGADGYVTKPFRPESLVRAVRTVLGLPTDQGGVDVWGNPDTKSPRF